MPTKLTHEQRRGKANHDFAKDHHNADHIIFSTKTQEPVVAIYYNKGSEAYMNEETRKFFERVRLESQSRYGDPDDQD